MTTKVSELEGIDLDYWVAQITGSLRMIDGSREFQLGGYSPSTQWRHGGPIIEDHDIAIIPSNFVDENQKWSASTGCYNKYIDESLPLGEDAGGATGKTPLIAAMRALVASVYGESVPEAQP